MDMTGQTGDFGMGIRTGKRIVVLDCSATYELMIAKLHSKKKEDH